MTTVVWTESPVEYLPPVWIQASEFDTNVSGTFNGTVVEDEGSILNETVSSSSVTISPEPPSGTLTATISHGSRDVSGSVFAPNLLGMFRLVFVEYLDEVRTPIRVEEWDDIPPLELSPDVVEYRPHRLTHIDYTITATAVVGSTSHSRSWVLRVLPDWSAGRDKLRQLIGERY